MSAELTLITILGLATSAGLMATAGTFLAARGWLYASGRVSVGRAQATRARERSWLTLTDEPRGRIQYYLAWSGWRRFCPSQHQVWFLLAAAAILCLVVKNIWPLIILVLASALFMAFLARRARQEQRLLIKQIPDGLKSLADTLRAGYSLPQAIQFLAAETLPPLRAVFAALTRADDLNIILPRALGQISKQIRLPEWNMAAETLNTYASLGGNALPLFAAVAQTIRQQLNLEAEINSLTAAGRASGYLIAVLAPLVVAVFSVLSPGYMAVLFSTLLGRLLLGLALMLEIIGFFWIRKIIAVEF